MTANVDWLAFLTRRFHQMVPQPNGSWDPVRVRHLRCWLKDDVAPVLAEYSQRPRFRRQALWPIATLRPGVETAERALVDRVDAGLVGHAQALRTIARPFQVQGQLESASLKDVVTEDSDLVEGGNSPVENRPRESANQLAVLLGQLEAIADRFWSDLVCVEDYFEPLGGWMERNGARRQAAEFVVSINPELHRGGDFVSRCLCRRVEVLGEILADVRRTCWQVCQRLGGRSSAAWDKVDKDAQELTALIGQLRQACLGGDRQPLRDACVLLTQAHAALAPAADLSWLGLPDKVVGRGAMVMGHRLIMSCDPELLERLVVSLSQLPGLYAGVDAPQSAREEAIARGGLVLVRSEQHVFWQGSLINVQWTNYRALWPFLQQLVEKGRRGATVEQRDLYQHSVAESTLGTSLMRLKKLLPASLWKHIVATKDPRGYRLDIDRQHIHLF